MNPNGKLPPIGKHWLVELYGCDSELLEKITTVQTALSEAARVSGATIVTENFHQFSPYGVSGVIVIEESHFTIHTWPEYGYAAIDLFTCGDLIDNQKATQSVTASFKASRTEVRYFQRGELPKALAHAKVPR